MKTLKYASLWEQTREYLGYWSSNRKTLLGMKKEFKLSDDTPSDWTLRLGDLMIRISWYGDSSDGCWMLNFPFNMKCIYKDGSTPDVEWRLLETSSLEEAKILAEEYFDKELSIADHLIQKSLDHARQVSGKPMERLILKDGQYHQVHVHTSSS